jgi:uracil-DNA glycosylase
MSTSLDHLVVAAYRGRPAEELLEAPPSALHGVSAADARRLEEAFGIRTVRQLAENPYFWRALAVRAAAGLPDFDPGPPPSWAAFFANAPLNYYTNHAARRFRLDFGPVYYRGRLDGTARVLVVGQDPSTNEILAHRIFAGLSGQRVQGFLHKLGLTRSYVMVNTFLFSVFGQFDTELRAISLEPPIRDFRNALLSQLAAENRLQAVVTFGSGARHAVEHWQGAANLPVIHATHPAAPDTGALLASWNQALDGLRPLVEPDEGAAADLDPYGATLRPTDAAPIPAFDLPFGVPAWHGAGGGRSERNGNKEIVWKAA